jgi:hypothetical protein
MKSLSWSRYRSVDRSFLHLRRIHLRALRRKQKTQSASGKQAATRH